jgi:hypothetical protein
MDQAIRTRRRIVLVAVVCLALTGGACRRKDSGGADPASGGAAAAQASAPVVLRVEASSYTMADFETYLRLNAGEEWRTLAAPALSGLFDNYVEEKILLVQAKSQNIAPAESEIADYLFRFKSASGAGVPAVAFDPQAVRDKLQVEKYLSSLLGGLSVPEPDVTAYYDAHKNEFLQPERVQVSQILCETEGEATETLNGLKNATEAQFREAVKAKSKGIEAARGGLLGVFSAGQLPADLEKVIFALHPGEISRVVESSYGFHIFRLDRRFESKLQTLIEARPAITAKLLDQTGKAAVAAHIEELKSALDWKAETDKLPFVYQRNEQ